MKVVGKLLGIILIFVAFYTFDFQVWNKILISATLLLSGLSLLFQDSENNSYRSLSRFLQRTALFIAILLLIKYLLFD